MKALNKVELKIDGFEKCHFILDNDCPLGQLHDYVCAIKAFIMQKMMEADQAQKKE